MHLNITLELFNLYFSIKFLNEDEWMIDPVMIADTYGPEVSLFLLYHYFSSINKYSLLISFKAFTKDLKTITMVFQGLDFVVDGGVRLAQSSTVVDMTKLPPRVLREGKVVICHLITPARCSNFKEVNTTLNDFRVQLQTGWYLKMIRKLLLKRISSLLPFEC